MRSFLDPVQLRPDFRDPVERHVDHYGMQHLDRDIAIVLEIVREIDGGHATGAEFPFEPIAVGERLRQAIESVRSSCVLLFVGRRGGTLDRAVAVAQSLEDA